MDNNRISIKRTLLGILAISIAIIIGIGIAKADTVPARRGLDPESDLSLQVARRALDLSADLSTRLTRDELLDLAALNRLDSVGGQLDALDKLDKLDSARVDALEMLDTFDNLDGRLLG